MHVFFSGIGGTGIGPLALIAHKAGMEVSGSDMQSSEYIEYLQKHGIKNIHIGQTPETLDKVNSNNPIDWFVYSSAIPKTNPNHPELTYVKNNGIKHSKRDEFLNEFLKIKNLKMIAIAGTHGKTTTTAMAVWVFKQLGIPISYSVGAKLNFGEMGEYDPKSKYFVYEADEYDRNFLSFNPEITIISGIDYDHPDIYPTRESYYQAFVEFICQSNEVFAHREDLERIGMAADDESTVDLGAFALIGLVNRKNAQLVAEAVIATTEKPVVEIVQILNEFPGVSRRFEKITENIYSDYAHTPEKIRGALQIAQEVASKHIVAVYEGLHNTRQHFIRDELDNLFEGVKKLYIVPSYLARENESLEMLTPEKLCEITREPADREPAELDEGLKSKIMNHVSDGDLVLCFSAGGGGSLDEWLRKEFSA